MALEISSLRELSEEQVADMLATFAALMQERHPNVELTRGAFHDLVLYFNSVLNAAVKENIDRILRSRSLLEITTDPALAEDELVDHVLSNFNVSRDAGAYATGTATFVFLQPIQTVIPGTLAYTAAEVQFLPTTTFTVLPPGSTAADSTQRVMVAVGDGTYRATIPFAATTIGTAGNVKRGTEFRADSLPNNLSEVFAASDFVSGADPATNAEYLNKLSVGLAAKTIGGRKSYEAFIRSFDAYKNIAHCSVLGYGDAEQQRDQHSLFPISGGGKVDVYLQTHAYPQEIEHTLEATYIGVGLNGTLWQVALGRDLSPGFYDVVRVAKTTDTTTNGYAVVNDIRGVDLSSATYVPDILTVQEGAYTAYQTAVIQFEDSDTLSAGLVANESKAVYTVTTRGLPLIKDIHETLADRENRPRGTDILARAAVPCFTSISFEIKTDANEVLSADTITAIKKEIVAAVAAVGFSGQLHSSVIAKAVHKYLTGRQAVGHIDMFGKIRRPDGTVGYLRDGTIIKIPNDPTRFVTGRTTAFLVSEDDISVSYTAAGFTV
jgi:hypothetical protein